VSSSSESLRSLTGASAANAPSFLRVEEAFCLVYAFLVKLSERTSGFGVLQSLRVLLKTDKQTNHAHFA